MMSADPNDQAPDHSNDELHVLRSKAEEAKLTNGREMAESACDRATAATAVAERSRQEQQGLVERHRQL